MNNLLRASLLCLCAPLALADTSSPSPQPTYPDDQGVIRWQANHEEVRLFGANYCAFSGGDYRMAAMVGADHKTLIDTDMAHFARMGWDGLRLCTWGDWENADTEGNFIENEHSQLMDYLVTKATERGIYMLLTPIHTYNPAWADKFNDPSYAPKGFSSIYPRPELGTNPQAIAAQTKYITQMLNHVNPHSQKALKDEPNILLVEMINEPIHHPENLSQSIEYINTLVDAVRSTGSQQITFHNLTQDFKIIDALAASKVQGASFGWYPSGLVSGRELRGNFLPSVDNYDGLLDPKIASKARIVYEFDQGDLNTGYLFPAIARSFREVGTQFAAIFAYDMLDSAPYNLGWQTHFVNLVHTPRQAVSAVIAGEAMRRLPAKQDFGSYPENNQFGDFSVDYTTDSSLLNAADAYMNAGDTHIKPRNSKSLTRLVGFGSSPLVSYEGTGAYFLDKVSDGLWRLEVYPDAMLVSDPFAQQRPDKIVSRLYFKNWPMTLQLPDLGKHFSATPITLPNGSQGDAQVARNSSIKVAPGVWLLSKKAKPDLNSLPKQINRVGFTEYHVNKVQTYPDTVLPLTAAEFIEGQDVAIRVRFASAATPEHLSLYLRSASGWFDQPIPLTRLQGYDYGTTLPAKDLPAGHYDYMITYEHDGKAVSFPGAITGKPGKWPFSMENPWHFSVNKASTPLEIFNARADFSQLSFVRLREGENTNFYNLTPGEHSGLSALSLWVAPFSDGTMPAHYATGMYIGDKIAARNTVARKAESIDIRLHASAGKRKTLDVYLIEQDGSSWRGQVIATSEWATQNLPLTSLLLDRSLHLPTPFPGLWNYWRPSPKARASSKIQPENIERIEFRVHPNQGANAADDARSVEIESMQLKFN